MARRLAITEDFDTTHDTICLTQHIAAPVADVWAGYADTSRRTQWAVPAGDGIVYDRSDFREEGRDQYRCGHPEKLEFHVDSEYIRIVPQQFFAYTETVRSEGTPLSTSVLTWTFEPIGGGTLVKLTNQVVSFVGAGMIDGNRNGHTKVLVQLERFLNRS